MRDGVPSASRRKLFEINGLNATVSYFGLAEINDSVTFEQFLDVFTKDHGASDLEAFANSLTLELCNRVDKDALKKCPSGLHVCGFTASATPEFWFVRNVRGIDDKNYVGFDEVYTATEELRGHHQALNFDESKQDFINQFGMNFANGDLRPFHYAWRLFDLFAENMVSEGVAAQPTSHEDAQKRLEWKMQAIAGFYSSAAIEPSIGGPITTVVLSPIVI